MMIKTMQKNKLCMQTISKLLLLMSEYYHNKKGANKVVKLSINITLWIYCTHGYIVQYL